MNWNDTYTYVKERRPDIHAKVVEIRALSEMAPEGIDRHMLLAVAEGKAMEIVSGLLDEIDTLRRTRDETSK